MATIEDQFNQFKIFNNENVLIVMALAAESGSVLQQNGYKIFYTGVGLINSAIHLTRVLEKSLVKPDRIINLGWAGSREITVGTLVEVYEVCHRGVHEPFLPKPLKLECLNLKDQVICGSADYVEQFSDGSSLQKNYHVMDMELYALASVARLFKVPLHSYKFITDRSDKNMMVSIGEQIQSSHNSFLNFLKELNELEHKNLNQF